MSFRESFKSKLGAALGGYIAGAITVGILLWRDVGVLKAQISDLKEQLENLQEMLRVLMGMM